MKTDTVADKVTISLITGFLGSGKTTVINNLLTTPAMAKTMVLVNEFGQISIDSDLIKRSDDTIVEMKNGCVCCSLNDDLGTTLHDFIKKRRSGDTPPFENVLIEATGLANAGPIVQVILEDPLVRDDYRLDKVITTVDTVHGVATLDIHAESVEQAAIADRLILTKLDRLETKEDKARLAELRARLEKLNPSTPILEADHGQVNTDILFNEGADEDLARYADPAKWSKEDQDYHHEDGQDPAQGSGDTVGGLNPHRHDHHIKSFCIVRDAPLPREGLQQFWATLAEEAGPNLLRVKGLVKVAGHAETPAVVQGVQQTFDEMDWLPRWPSDDRRTRLVFIGWQIEEEHIQQLMEAAGAANELA